MATDLTNTSTVRIAHRGVAIRPWSNVSVVSRLLRWQLPDFTHGEVHVRAEDLPSQLNALVVARASKSSMKQLRHLPIR